MPLNKETKPIQTMGKVSKSLILLLLLFVMMMER